MFSFYVLNVTKITYIKRLWDYNYISCHAYQTEGIDTILADGTIDEECVMNAVINGETENHLDMLELEAIEHLFEFKWATFARVS